MKPALIIAVHGSITVPTAAAPAREVANTLAGTGRFASVMVGGVKEEPSVEEALRRAGEGPVWVVPFFLSEGWYTTVVLPRRLSAVGAPYQVTRAVGTSPRMVDAILERAATCPHEPPETALILVGHGTARSKTSRDTALTLAGTLAELGRYAEVCAVFTDDEPGLESVGALTRAGQIVAVPLLAGAGFHGTDVASSMAVPGRKLVVTAPVGSSPVMVDAVLERLRSCGALD